jgi:hypothetical protein
LREFTAGFPGMQIRSLKWRPTILRRKRRCGCRCERQPALMPPQGEEIKSALLRYSALTHQSWPSPRGEPDGPLPTAGLRVPNRRDNESRCPGKSLLRRKPGLRDLSSQKDVPFRGRRRDAQRDHPKCTHNHKKSYRNRQVRGLGDLLSATKPHSRIHITPCS